MTLSQVKNLDTRNISRMLYPVYPPVKWLSLDEFFDYCSIHQIDPLTRLLLASDGSVTRLLKALLLSPVKLEVQRQEIAPLDQEMADYLETDPDQMAINRDIWLMRGDQERLIYAYSVLPVSRINKRLFQEITQSKKPLGALIAKYNLPALRDRLVLGLVQSKQIASDLGLPKEHSFWARCYRLSAKEELMAAIFEIFSPRIIKV